MEFQRYVHKEFLRILDESDWMDEKTKRHAKAKVSLKFITKGASKIIIMRAIIIIALKLKAFRL